MSYTIPEYLKTNSTMSVPESQTLSDRNTASPGSQDYHRSISGAQLALPGDPMSWASRLAPIQSQRKRVVYNLPKKSELVMLSREKVLLVEAPSRLLGSD